MVLFISLPILIQWLQHVFPPIADYIIKVTQWAEPAVNLFHWLYFVAGVFLMLAAIAIFLGWHIVEKTCLTKKWLSTDSAVALSNHKIWLLPCLFIIGAFIADIPQLILE